MPEDPLKKRDVIVRDGAQLVYEDGVLFEEIPQGDGVRKRYHVNGAVASEAPCVNRKTHGIVRSWHDNGQLASEAQCVHGEYHGISRYWDRDGTLLREHEHVLPNAIHGVTYAEAGRVHHVYLWNGKPVPKARWLKRVEATRQCR